MRSPRWNPSRRKRSDDRHHAAIPAAARARRHLLRAAVTFSVYLFYYYWTSTGGPMVLAMTLVPVVYVLFTLHALRQNEFYPKLPISVTT